MCFIRFIWRFTIAVKIDINKITNDSFHVQVYISFKELNKSLHDNWPKQNCAENPEKN